MKPNLFTLLLLLFVASTAGAQKYDRSLIAQLDSIARTDQQYRSIKVQASAKTPEADRDNMRLQSSIDALNLAKIDTIIRKYGYPGKSLVGEKYQSVAFMVIQHNEPPAREKYLPLIMAAAEKGELRSSSLAIMIDRSKTDKGEKQIYGSQLHETKDGVKLIPIEDEENVNIRRAKVGMQPLEDYLKAWKIAYRVPSANWQNPAAIYYVASSSPSLEIIGGTAPLFAQLKYPQEAKEKNIKGSVTIQITVEATGKLKDASVIKSLGYGCDEEALRIIKLAKFKNNVGEDWEMRVNVPFPYISRQ